MLEGIRVVELAAWTFVPAAGAVLADWGADVIKVEHPVTGDPQRGLVSTGMVEGAGHVNYFVEQPNRGKRSIGIDVRHPDGLAVLYRLVEQADVFLTNLLPGSCARLGVDVESIRARNPGIVYARGHGQGVRGEEAERGAYDLAAYWARSGIAAAYTAADGDYPPLQRPAFGDVMGGLTIAGGIAAALVRRERTGETAVVDVSLLNVGLWNLAFDVLGSRAAGRPTPRFDRARMTNPVANVYRTADDRYIYLVFLQSDRHWPELCRAADRPDLLDDPRFATAEARFEHRRECIEELERVFAAHSLDEWKHRLAHIDGVWAPAQTALEAAHDPQAAANGYLPEVAVDDGTPFPVVASPVQFDEEPIAVRARAPGHGEHTEAILLELGFDWDGIAALKESAAVL